MSEEARDPSGKTIDERLVYVMPQDSRLRVVDNEIGLLDLWKIVWRSKWLVVLVTALFAVVSLVYVFGAAEWYEASALLAPATNQSTEEIPAQLRALGSLAGLAGIGAGGGDATEAIAILRSREFVRAFIRDRHLMPVFLDDGWIPDKQPDLRDAVKFFRKKVLSVSQNVDTKLVTLSVDWTDPQVAADWANTLVVRLNSDMRQRALKEANANIGYLRKALRQTNLATLRQSIGNLLEAQLQKAMLAQGNKQFAFKIIDRAQVPKERSRPKRALIVALAVFLGAVCSIFVVFIRYIIRNDDLRNRHAIGRD